MPSAPSLNQVYVISKALFRNAWYVSFGENQWQLNKGKVGTKSVRVQLYDLGDFWIEKELDNVFQRTDNHVVLEGKDLLYSKYYSDVSVSSYNNANNQDIPMLYNLNPNYDISLFDNAKFITGVVEFDSINNNNY